VDGMTTNAKTDFSRRSRQPQAENGAQTRMGAGEKRVPLAAVSGIFFYHRAGSCGCCEYIDPRKRLARACFLTRNEKLGGAKMMDATCTGN